jgi:hypothetical protein
MKTMKKLSFILLFFALSFHSMAQDSLYQVLIEQGFTNKISNKKIFPLLSGSYLSRKDSIKMGQDSYLVLLYNQTELIEITNAGILNLDSLEKAQKQNFINVSFMKDSVINVSKNLVIQKDLHKYFFASTLIQASKIDIEKNTLRYVSNFLSHVRVCRCIKTHLAEMYYTRLYEERLYGYDEKENMGNIISEPIITLHMFCNDRFYKSQHKNKEIIYQVTITDFSNKVIYTKEVPVKDTKNNEAILNIDFSKWKFKYDSDFIVVISLKNVENYRENDNNHNSYLITLETGNKRMKNELSKKQLALNEPMVAKTALYHILKAFVYDSENYDLDAIRHYEAAIALQPNIDAYKILYEDFIVKKRMKDAKQYYLKIAPLKKDFLRSKYK